MSGSPTGVEAPVQEPATAVEEVRETSPRTAHTSSYGFMNRVQFCPSCGNKARSWYYDVRTTRTYVVCAVCNAKWIIMDGGTYGERN